MKLLTGKLCLELLLMGVLATCVTAPATAEEPELVEVLSDDFEQSAEQWEPVGGSEWEVIEQEGNHVYRMTGKTPYNPPVRSPKIISLARDLVLGDFELTARVESTNYKAGAHRDMCLFWGMQDASHFYYVHLGAKADPHSCQIFIVNGKPRKAITVKKAQGTPWEKRWHQVKVVRRTADGTMEVYFDDMETPFMTAQDKTFTWGRIGIGTFDDNGNWDDVVIRGVRVEQPEKK